MRISGDLIRSLPWKFPLKWIYVNSIRRRVELKTVSSNQVGFVYARIKFPGALSNIMLIALGKLWFNLFDLYLREYSGRICVGFCLIGLVLAKVVYLKR